MVNSAITGYADTIMNYKWTYLWGITSATAFTKVNGAATNVSPSLFFGFVGAAFAFLLSVMGAVENAS